MGVLGAGLAWTILVVVIISQVVFNKFIDSFPGAHLFGYGPAIVGFLIPIQIAFDLMIVLFAIILTVFALRDTRRDSGRRVGT
jgi:hypothetical protein